MSIQDLTLHLVDFYHTFSLTNHQKPPLQSKILNPSWTSEQVRPYDANKS